MQSCFGNYVMQKAIEIATGVDKKMLALSCKKYLEKIKDSKIRAKWEKIVENAEKLCDITY